MASKLTSQLRASGRLVPAFGLEPPVLAPLIITAVAVVLYAAAPLAPRFPATVAGSLTFGLLTAFVPGVAVRRKRPVAPINWFLLLFFLQLVVNPLLICFAGPFQNTLRELPSDLAINIAELVNVIGFLGFSVGCEWHRRRTVAGDRTTGPDLTPRPWRIAAVFFVLGVVGLAIAYHSPGALIAYFSQPSGHVGLAQKIGGGPVKVASLVLRSCLQFAALVPWCVWLDRRRPAGWRLWSVTTGVALAVAVAEATFSYNRGSIAAPLIAILGVLGARRIRIRLSVLLAIGLIGFAVLAAARTYRNSHFSFGQALTSGRARSTLIANTNLDREVQIYANAPQYLGFLLDRERYGARPKYGLTLLSSVLSPIPTLGRPFRPTSGPSIFNHQIYGPTSGVVDQIVPFQGELFLDFTYPGVLIGCLLLGFLGAALQRGFERSGDAFRAFAWLYVSIWSGFLVIGSASVASQQLIYFYWPVIGLLALAEVRRRHPTVRKSQPRGA